MYTTEIVQEVVPRTLRDFWEDAVRTSPITERVLSGSKAKELADTHKIPLDTALAWLALVWQDYPPNFEAFLKRAIAL